VSRELRKPRPIPTPVSQPLWDALREERVALQHCGVCGAWVYDPRARCPRCLGDDLPWEDVAGTGTVFTYTVAPEPTAPPFADEVPQVIAVVALDEGVHVTSTIAGAPDAVAVGAPVVPVFDHGDDGITLLRFRLRD
jgi:uncharacterized OB-fold protein